MASDQQRAHISHAVLARSNRVVKLFNDNDPYPFLKLTSDLFSDEEPVRAAADSLYNDALKQLPGTLARTVAITIANSPLPDTRIRCGKILSRILVEIWLNLNPIFKNDIKSSFAKILQNEDNWDSLEILCTCISSLGAMLLPSNEWPELLPLMFQCLKPPASVYSKWGSMFLFNNLIPKCPDVFHLHVYTLNGAFLKLMGWSTAAGAVNDRVRAATVGACVKLIVHLGSPSNQHELYYLLTGMKELLYTEDIACKVLDEMILLVRAKPAFLTVHINFLVKSMLEILSDTMEDEVRQQAVRFFVSVAESGIIQNLPKALIEDMLTELLKMLKCVNDDVSWGEANTDDSDAGKTSIFLCAEDAWSRLAIALSGDVIVLNSPDDLPGFFEDDNDWTKRYAAITALGLVTRGCSKTLAQYREKSMEKIMELVKDQHPRVRWAAIHAIGEFSKYFYPDFQEDFHQQVIPALLEAMDDFSNPRVQTRAAAALQLFCTNCSSNILKPYMRDIISKLLIFLQKGKAMSKEASLAALASIAESTMDDFQPFYGLVMPYLKLILVTVEEDSNFMLVAKSLECIAAIAVAVGKSVFCADVEQVVKVLVSLQESSRTEDEVRSCLLQAWGGLCRSLGEDFIPYLSASMPQLIQSANRTDYLTDDDCVKVAAGNSNIELRNSILKEKLLACDMLACFAAYMKGGLHLWIKEAADAVIPLVNFKFDERVRIVATSAIPFLLKSAAIAMEKKLPVPDFGDSPIYALSDTIIQALLEALQESSIKLQSRILATLNLCIQFPHTWIREEMARVFVEGIGKIFSASVQRKVARENRVNTGTGLRKPELLNEEIQDDEDLYREIRISLGGLIKRFRATVLPFFDDLLPHVEHIWKNDNASQEKAIALSVFHDISEQCKEEAFRHYDTCIPFLIKACKDTNPVIAETAAYAIGICAEFGGEVFKPHLQDGLSSLEAVFEHSGELGTEKIMAKEAAVSAYGKVCFFFREEISTYEWAGWISHLPLKNNLDEAKVAHRLLCSMIEELESKVIGPNDIFIPRIIMIMAEVLWAGRNLATDETQKMMISQLKMFRQKLTEPVFMGHCRSLRLRLQNMLHGMI